MNLKVKIKLQQADEMYKRGNLTAEKYQAIYDECGAVLENPNAPAAIVEDVLKPTQPNAAVVTAPAVARRTPRRSRNANLPASTDVNSGASGETGNQDPTARRPGDTTGGSGQGDNEGNA